MPARIQIPEVLRRARRGLDALSAVALLRDWEASSGRWFLEIALKIDSGVSDAIPPETRWHIVTSDSYPEGILEIYPSGAGGITTTFHHQSHNSRGDQSRPWRRGNLCITQPTAGVLRKISQSEPFDPDTRLRWRVERALEWLELAASEKLARSGDPYEVPPLPTEGNEMVVFNENAAAFVSWTASQARFGTFLLKRLPHHDSIRAATSFADSFGNLILEPAWGYMIRQEARQEVGIWIRLPDEPVVNQWHVPETWEKLSGMLEGKGVSLSEVLRNTYGHLRNASAPVVAIGFPIPESFSGPQAQMHWFFIQLPVIRARGERKKRHRYPNAVFWERDRTLNLSGTINWISGENWSPETLGSRGQLPENITHRKVLLLGAGALGASVAELLVRGGAHTLTVIDGDSLSAGNLVRHTLEISDIGDGKATRLARHLNRVSPHANVEGIDARFSAGEEKMRSLASGHSLVIDCTAEDGVVKALESIAWEPNTLLCSFALSFGAERLYAYAQKKSFDSDRFFSLLSPYVTDDLARHPPEAFPREGVGCWHPIFPAPNERVVQVACKAVSLLAERSESLTEAGSFEVL